MLVSTIFVTYNVRKLNIFLNNTHDYVCITFIRGA